MKRQTERQTDGKWIGRQTEGQMYGQTDCIIDYFVDSWTERQIDRQMDRQSNTDNHMLWQLDRQTHRLFCGLMDRKIDRQTNGQIVKYRQSHVMVVRQTDTQTYGRDICTHILTEMFTKAWMDKQTYRLVDEQMHRKKDM